MSITLKQSWACAVFFLCALTSFGQEVPLERDYYAPSLSTNYLSLQVGLNMAVGSYGASPTAEAPLFASFYGEDGMGGKGGFGLGVSFTGRLSGFKSKSSNDYRNLWYPVGHYAVTYNYLQQPSWEEVIPEVYSNGSINSLSMDIGVGLGKNIDDKYAVELIPFMGLTFSGLPNFYNDTEGRSFFMRPNADRSYDRDDEFGSFFSYGVHTAIRNQSWRIGISYRAIIVNNYFYKVKSEIPDNGIPNFDTDLSFFSNFSITTLQFSIGYIL